MDLRLIAYFVAVVEHGGITRAARALYLAQPSLSQAVRTLERQLDVQLFDRGRGALTLTADGERFAAHARQILDDVASARERAEAVRDLRAGRLDLATHSTLAVDPLPALASGLHREHPDVLLNVLDPGSAGGVTEQVRRGQAELGLVELPTPTGTLHVCELWEHEIVLALPPRLADTVADPVPHAAIATIPLVLESSEASGSRRYEDALGEALGDVAVECAHRQGIWELVRHGAGATPLPRPVAETELRDVCVRSIDPPIRRTVALVMRPAELSPAAAAFRAHAEVMRRDPSARS